MSGWAPGAEQALVDSLHHAAIDPSGWQEFIFLLEKNLPGVGTSIFGMGPGGRQPVYVASGAGLDPAGLEQFVCYYHAISPFTGFLGTLSPGCTRRTAADLSDEAIEHTEFYNDWMRHQDDLIGGVALKTKLHQARSLVVAVNIRRKGRDAMDRRTQELLDRLEPHISHAFQMGEVIGDLKGRILADDALGQQGAMVITDHNMLVVWADPAAMAMAGKALRIDMVGRMSFMEADAQAWALRLVCREASGKAAAGLFRTASGCTIRAMSGGAVTPASPLFPGAFRGANWPARQIVFVISLQRHQPRPAGQQLMERFLLSRSEAEITLLIAEGCSTAEIAKARQVSRHTVRNQIRAVLCKMEARHRGDVVRIVVRGRESGS